MLTKRCREDDGDTDTAKGPSEFSFNRTPGAGEKGKIARKRKVKEKSKVTTSQVAAIEQYIPSLDTLSCAY